jgi:hypothetical protein
MAIGFALQFYFAGIVAAALKPSSSDNGIAAIIH